MCNKYFPLYLIFRLVLKAQFCPVVGANHGHALDMGTVSIRLLQIFCGRYAAHTLR